MSDTLRMNATCVDLDGAGVLLRGPSGSGKSDLALRLIDAGARLVADDFVELAAVGGGVAAQPPESLSGLLEVRGLGLMRLPHRDSVPVALLIDLVPPSEVPRLPDPESEDVLGVAVPRVVLCATEASAAAKVRAAAKMAHNPAICHSGAFGR